jgi:hypothetical protein
MNTTKPVIGRRNLFRVRPRFLLACAAFIVALILPDAISGNLALQRSFLLLASIAIVAGWFFLLKYRDQNSRRRAWVALITSVCLTASVPVFYYELSPIRWIMHHPMFSNYVRPWVHWGYQGYLPVVWGVVGSFFGRGRARIAFLVGSILLWILRASMGAWVAW